MSLSVGIVGLPNVGKSTLFNALLKKQAALAANYPFATIEPNIGIVPVPDARLEQLAEITKEESSQLRSNNILPPIKPATVEFVDIAGLVKGASEGAGLGNKFLSHIRETQIVAHVVRAFNNEDIIREGSLNPRLDYGTIETELILADLQTVSKARERLAKSKDPIEKQTIEKLYQELDKGTPARLIALTEEEQAFAKSLFLLSAKQEIVVINVSESEYGQDNLYHIPEMYSSLLVVPKERIVTICAQIESEFAEFNEQEQKEYLMGIGLKESGLERLIQTAYTTLGLISFLTAGEKEVKAWTIQKGINAQQAAGVIHTDFMKKFIKAEVVSYDDFVMCGGWKRSREKGKARLEGRDYVMKDGDVVEFKIGT